MKDIIKVSVAAYLILLVFLAHASSSEDSSQRYSLEVNGVVKASKEANGGKIYALTKQFKDNRYAGLFASASNYLELNFAQSEASARECFSKKDDGSLEYAAIHLICGQFISRIHFVNGEYGKWAAFNEDLMGESLTRLRQRSQKTAEIPFESLDMNYSELIDWPRLKVGPMDGFRHATPVTWKMISRTASFIPENTVPFIEIKINDTPTEAIFDTEASIFIIPENMVKELDLDPMSEIPRGMSTAHKVHLQAKIVRIKSLEIAGLRFHNAMAVVSKSASVPVLGLVQIMKLHKIVLSQSQMTVFDTTDHKFQCRERMYLGGDLEGFPNLLRITTVIGGHKRHPILDTGYGNTYKKTVHTMAAHHQEAIASVDAAGTKEMVGHMERETIGSGRSGPGIPGLVMLDEKNPASYTFGAQMITMLGPLYLDFDTGHACFLQNEATAGIDESRPIGG